MTTVSSVQQTPTLLMTFEMQHSQNTVNCKRWIKK